LQVQAAVLVSTTGTAATPPPKSQKPDVNINNNIEDIAVVKDRLNAIDKEQELVIHLLRRIMTKR
jgi:hypothetical protein